MLQQLDELVNEANNITKTNFNLSLNEYQIDRAIILNFTIYLKIILSFLNDLARVHTKISNHI